MEKKLSNMFSSMSKEDLIDFLKDCDVELVFMELNREGILSQRVPHYAHDTNRNPMFPMDISGWSADLYNIRKKGER